MTGERRVHELRVVDAEAPVDEESFQVGCDRGDAPLCGPVKRLALAVAKVLPDRFDLATRFGLPCLANAFVGAGLVAVGAGEGCHAVALAGMAVVTADF